MQEALCRRILSPYDFSPKSFPLPSAADASNRINQPGKEELSLLIYTQKGTLKLTINANAADCGVYFTTDNPPNPLTAPNFCMLLRKYLQGCGDLERGDAGL